VLAASITLLGKMAINKSYVSTNSVDKFNGTNIEMLATEPRLNGILDQPKTPGQLVGYYDGTNDVVLLFVVLGSGLRMTRVG